MSIVDVTITLVITIEELIYCFFAILNVLCLHIIILRWEFLVTLFAEIIMHLFPINPILIEILWIPHRTMILNFRHLDNTIPLIKFHWGTFCFFSTSYAHFALSFLSSSKWLLIYSLTASRERHTLSLTFMFRFVAPLGMVT